MFLRSKGLWSLGIAAAVSLAGSLTAHAAGDAALGQKKFYTCYGCHGIVNYRNAYPDYEVPELRHQFAAYIVDALQEYKNKERPHPTMHAQASSLSAQDMEDIAAYLQGPEPVRPSSTIVGTLPQQAQVCAACHGSNGLGVDAALVPKPPILAGQHESYLIQALTQYRAGLRQNAVMIGMARSLASDADVRMVAHYFASQRSPLATATTDSR